MHENKPIQTPPTPHIPNPMRRKRPSDSPSVPDGGAARHFILNESMVDVKK